MLLPKLVPELLVVCFACGSTHVCLDRSSRISEACRLVLRGDHHRAVFVFGGVGYFLVILIQAGVLWAVAVVMLLIFGPIFGLIVWATRRNLRKLESSRHKSRAAKL